MKPEFKELIEERAKKLIDKYPDILGAMMDEILSQAQCYQMFMEDALERIDMNLALYTKKNTEECRVVRNNVREAITKMTMDKLALQYYALEKLREETVVTDGDNEFVCDACCKEVRSITQVSNPPEGVKPYKICVNCKHTLKHNLENITRGLREQGVDEIEISRRLAKITKDFVRQNHSEVK